MACRLEFPKSEKAEARPPASTCWSSWLQFADHWHLSSCVPTNRSARGLAGSQHKLLISAGTRLSRGPPIVKLDGGKRLALHVESLAAGDGSLLRACGSETAAGDGGPLTDRRFSVMGGCGRGRSMIFTRASIFRNLGSHVQGLSPQGLSDLGTHSPCSIPMPAPGPCGEPVLVSCEGRHRAYLQLAMRTRQFWTASGPEGPSQMRRQGPLTCSRNLENRWTTMAGMAPRDECDTTVIKPPMISVSRHAECSE